MQAPQQAPLPGARALATFCRQDEKKEFTEELRSILEVTAWTGNYWHEWPLLKDLLSFRLKQVLIEYHESYIDASEGACQPLVTGETFNELLKRLEEGLDSFVDGPPFTLQRLCEVLLNPKGTYPNIDKVALAFEKLLLVTSTIPICSKPYPSLTSSKEHSFELPVQQQQQKQNCEAAKANGELQGRPMIDQEMTEASAADGKQFQADRVSVDESKATLQSKILSFSSEGNKGVLPESGKASVDSEAPLVDDELVDIALEDDQRVRMEA